MFFSLILGISCGLSGDGTVATLYKAVSRTRRGNYSVFFDLSIDPSDEFH